MNFSLKDNEQHTDENCRNDTAEILKRIPKNLTVSPAPHLKSPDRVTSIMRDVLIALLPALIWGVYIFGFRVLVIVAISVGSCVLFEFLYEKVCKKPITIHDLSACVSGVLLAYCLPVSVPLWMPVAGAFFAIVVVKQLFGGIGKNFMNPALAARVFLFSWPKEMTAFTEPFADLAIFRSSVSSADAVSSATTLSYLKQGILSGESLSDLFLGVKAGCIGEVSALMLLAGAGYLLYRRIITLHTPIAYLSVVALWSLLFPHGISAVDFCLQQLLSGGLILAAFFMATDYATTPITKSGKVIFGIGCGILTMMIRYFGGYAEGVSFAVLIMNLSVWYIDRITMHRVFGGRQNERKQN